MRMCTIGKEMEQGTNALASVKAISFPRLSYVDLFITHRCNFACDYCFVEDRNSRDSTWDVLNATVRFVLRESAPGSNVSFVLFGGEPLIRFDLIRDFIPFARREFIRRGRSVNFSITTNGSLINPQVMAFFRSYGINLLLSIDGGRASQDAHRKFPNGGGTFDTVSKLLPMMKYFQPYLGARVTPTPETVGNLHSDFRELLGLGINHFIIGCATGIEWKEFEYEIFFREMRKVIADYIMLRKKGVHLKVSLLDHFLEGSKYDVTNFWGCSAGRSRISVDAEGNVQACAKIQGSYGLKGFLPMGNVFEGFTEEGLKNRAEYFAFPIEKRQKCLECELKKVCAGGCPATNYCSTGSVHECPEEHCQFERQVIKLQDYFHNMGGAELAAAG